MKTNLFITLYVCLMSLMLLGCKKKKEDTNTPDPPAPKLIFKFKFDSTQVRLNNLGQASTVPSGHATQSPIFQGMSAHYIEMSRTATEALGAGAVLYHAPETAAGGATAINFDSSIIAGQNEVFYSIPLSQIPAGTYQYLRVSLAYQNYDIKIKYLSSQVTARVASFLGYNTYITSFKPDVTSIVVNDDKLQGFWGLEYSGFTFSGNAPAGSTTVPNPLFATSPVPSGSCVVTGPFSSGLTITGSETSDIVITVSLSTNQSFEWIDATADGLFEPGAPGNEQVVDMGVRGLIPIVN